MREARGAERYGGHVSRFDNGSFLSLMEDFMANTFEMSGKGKVLFEPLAFASGLMKREFVVTMEDDNPLL